MDQTILNTTELIEVALAGQHRPVELLQNYRGYLIATQLYKGIRKVALGFQKAAKLTYKEYLQSVRAGDMDVSILMSYKLLQRCTDFYSEELDTVIHMLDEFDLYARSGHILSTYILGEDRSPEDQYDYLEKRKGNILIF